MSGNTIFQVEFEMEPNGRIVSVKKIGGGDGGEPPKAPAPPHSDIVVMIATKHSPGHLCFWLGNQWVCI